MASPRNQHCANCIGTLSFPIFVALGSKKKWLARYRINKVK